MNGAGFRIQKQFEDNFALIGPDGLVWNVSHSPNQALKTQWGQLQRAFEMGREAERVWQKSADAKMAAARNGEVSRGDAEIAENTEGK